MNSEEKIKQLKELIKRNKEKIKKYEILLLKEISLTEREKIEIKYARQLEMMNSRLKRVKLLEKRND